MPGSILIVDDNPVNLRLMQAVLEAAGHDVHLAVDAPSALEAVASLHPRLILMDLQLPGMDGLELTRKLKADSATRDIVIVARTAYAMSDDEVKARQAGCDSYLTKPIDVIALPGIVSQYVGAGHGDEAEVGASWTR
jgi:two-component system, cell cycle response regulator DivK